MLVLLDMSQLLLFADFESTIPEDGEPIYRRRSISDLERAAHVQKLQAEFDARAKGLKRCIGCNGYVGMVDRSGVCPECHLLPITETVATMQPS